jgi:hypothetical protein
MTPGDRDCLRALNVNRVEVVGLDGVEPSTCRLRVECSTS